MRWQRLGLPDATDARPPAPASPPSPPSEPDASPDMSARTTAVQFGGGGDGAAAAATTAVMRPDHGQITDTVSHTKGTRFYVRAASLLSSARSRWGGGPMAWDDWNSADATPNACPLRLRRNTRALLARRATFWRWLPTATPP
jgi:hypothetical protein